MKHIWTKPIVIILLFSFLFLLLSSDVLAADYQTSYQVDYTAKKQGDQLSTLVNFAIAITNLRSDVYVKQFSVAFPQTFKISNLMVFDDFGQIAPKIVQKDGAIRVDMEFSNPSIGKNTVNTLRLEFNQDNVFKALGNVWEVILPTIQDTNGSYKVVVHLPDDSKKISIAKPKPDSVIITPNHERVITWIDPQTKTIYAVFGDKQYYQTQLSYHLSNTRLYPVYTDVAFPPDTSYQKILVNKIEPQPDSVSIDSDGNYLGRYFLKPREEKNILFQGNIVIYPSSREDNREVIARQFRADQYYLLSEKPYWKLPTNFNTSISLTNPSQIYSYVVSKLSYDYQRATSKNERLGAAGVLADPTKAVCVEFTDLYVALARDRGINSREIEGFGYANDPQLRPLSLISDVLHSWPEYYDTTENMWRQIDPTWENTSGIDYFSSLDLNHIAFVIHAKNSDYPLPAGMYKLQDSKDVILNAVDSVPMEYKHVSLTFDKLSETINDTQQYNAQLTVKNLGNVFLWNLPVVLSSDKLNISRPATIDELAPMQTISVPFTFRASSKNDKSNTTFIASVSDETISSNLHIIPFSYQIGLYIAFGLFIVMCVVVLFKLLAKKRPH